MNVKDLPQRVKTDLLEAHGNSITNLEAEIELKTPEEVFEIWLNWNGITNFFSSMIWDVARNLIEQTESQA